jgi:hypothetical protein
MSANRNLANIAGRYGNWWDKLLNADVLIDSNIPLPLRGRGSARESIFSRSRGCLAVRALALGDIKREFDLDCGRGTGAGSHSVAVEEQLFVAGFGGHVACD